METYTIKASNGWSYNQRATDEQQAYLLFRQAHPDLTVVGILNEVQAIMASLEKGFE